MEEDAYPNSADDTANGPELWHRATEIIPGGSQLLSKRAEMFAPGQWPAYYKSAKGVTIESVGGREYTDMSIMGVGACILGYADPEVNEKVHDTVEAGSMTTLNPPEEVDLAERLLEMHPWADMVRYGRPGGESMAIAVRLARAATGSSSVAFCGYHGWHDWYLAANLTSQKNLEEHLLPGLDPKGVPAELEGTAHPFNYNDLDAFERILATEDLGAVVLEPIRYEPPEADFVEEIAALAHDHGIPLIVDEITSGFRVGTGGAYERYDVTPDVVVYGKAIANGYPMGAIVGKEWVMDQAQESFISSTFWTERIGPAAALATIDKIEREDVPTHLNRIGTRIMAGWERLADEYDVEVRIKTPDMPPLATFKFDYGDRSDAMMTLFTQEMLERGFLAGGSVYVSYSHTDEVVEKYLNAVDDVFEEIATHLEDNTIKGALNGPIAHSTFERLN